MPHFASGLARSLQPVTTARLAETLDREDFASRVGAQVLMISVGGPGQAELAQALIASLSASATVPLVPTLGFRTVVGVRPPRGQPLVALAPVAPQAERSQIRARLVERILVAVPLKKREASGKAYSSRISVGRAMNNDVVLRHESVSKFHAWLEMDDEGSLYVFDAGSSNGTWLGDRRLVAKACTPVPAAVELRFAGVASCIYRADSLWDALRDDTAQGLGEGGIQHG